MTVAKKPNSVGNLLEIEILSIVLKVLGIKNVCIFVVVYKKQSFL